MTFTKIILPERPLHFIYCGQFTIYKLMENTFFKNLATTSAPQLDDAKSITTQKLQLRQLRQRIHDGGRIVVHYFEIKSRYLVRKRSN